MKSLLTRDTPGAGRLRPVVRAATSKEETVRHESVVRAAGAFGLLLMASTAALACY